MTPQHSCPYLYASLRWWVLPYLQTLKFFCLVLGTEPDMEAVMRFIGKHGIRFSKS
jgi:hypothetical protein